MGLFDKAVEILERAQHRVDFEVIDGMVAVVGITLEDGTEVDGVYAETRDVVQMVLDAREIPAEHVFAGGPGTPGHEPAYRLVAGTAAEPIRKYLVEYGVFCPSWSEHKR